MTLTRDRQTVNTKLPSNSYEMTTSNGVTGWVYSFFCELGNHYTMFVYNDGSLYQVLVISPDVAGQYGIHDAHLYGDGRICLTDATCGGLPTLEQAYSKSVLWATGFSVFLQTGKFPFNYNQ